MENVNTAYEPIDAEDLGALLEGDRFRQFCADRRKEVGDNLADNVLSLDALLSPEFTQSFTDVIYERIARERAEQKSEDGEEDFAVTRPVQDYLWKAYKGEEAAFDEDREGRKYRNRYTIHAAYCAAADFYEENVESNGCHDSYRELKARIISLGEKLDSDNDHERVVTLLTDSAHQDNRYNSERPRGVYQGSTTKVYVDKDYFTAPDKGNWKQQIHALIQELSEREEESEGLDHFVVHFV